MIDRRKEPRIPAILAVVVWGHDLDSQPFVQIALARNISGGGALLSNIKQPVRCGDVLGIRYRNKTARFRVVWFRESGLAGHFQVAVHKLRQDACPWEDALRLQATAGLAVSEAATV